MKMNRVALAVLGVFVVLLVGSGLLAYYFRDQPRPAATTPAVSPAAATTPADTPLLGELFGPDASGIAPANLASW